MKTIGWHKGWLVILLLMNASAGWAEPWFFVATGDSHSGASVPEIFLQVVQDVNQRRPEFLVLLGDGVENALPQNFEALTQACEKLQVPLHYVIGNHDVLVPGQSHSRHNYLKVRAKLSPAAPADKTYYAFTQKNCRFIVVDTAGWSIGVWGVKVSDAKQWDWLENELKAAQGKFDHIFVMMHVPTRNPLAQLGTNRNHWFTDRKEADDFDNLMARYKVSMVLCAHDHMFEKYEKDGVTYLLCGSTGGSIVAPSFLGGFYNYVEIHVNGKSLTTRVIPVLRSIEMEGKLLTVPAKETVQLIARGTYHTNSTVRITSPMTVSWSSSNPAVGTVDAKGNFTARAPGKTKVTVTCGLLKAETEVIVTNSKNGTKRNTTR
jgi:3',5'-cyclic AMP phosphodiesterase CpdA